MCLWLFKSPFLTDCELIEIIFSFQQIVCAIENFEFQYDDLRNNIDALADEYDDRADYSMFDPTDPMESVYYNYPSTRKHVIAVPDNTQHMKETDNSQLQRETVQPTFQVVPSSSRQSSVRMVDQPTGHRTFHLTTQPRVHLVAQPSSQSNNQSSVATKVVYTTNASSQKAARVKQRLPTNHASLSTKTKQTAPKVAVSQSIGQTVDSSYGRNAGPYHSQRVMMSPPSIPGAGSTDYYNQVASQRYMLRPIYVRLVKPLEKNYPAKRMTRNHSLLLSRTHHATMQ